MAATKPAFIETVDARALASLKGLEHGGQLEEIATRRGVGPPSTVLSWRKTHCTSSLSDLKTSSLSGPCRGDERRWMSWWKTATFGAGSVWI